MLHKAKTLTGYKLDSLDGEIGRVEKFYFDDKHWVVRHLVAEAGNWLTGREVLLSPYALGAVSTEKHHIIVDLSKKQIEGSPGLDRDKPVSRQFEESYYGYYGYPMYWAGSRMWGPYPYIDRDRQNWKNRAKAEKSWDPNLRSTSVVTGYHVEARDGAIGHVEDFVIDDETWAIRYLIVDTRNWWPGKQVLIAPQWIERVSWSESKVFIHLSREAIKQSPEFTDESALTRDYEDALHRHYNRRGYWTDEAAARAEFR
ncbi:MAG TPA: PRC-barrel domain-containing protein [Polyangia bacterium]